jgi:hypothetical protein
MAMKTLNNEAAEANFNIKQLMKRILKACEVYMYERKRS